jgi:hypothetical protein
MDYKAKSSLSLAQHPFELSTIPRRDFLEEIAPT